MVEDDEPVSNAGRLARRTRRRRLRSNLLPVICRIATAIAIAAAMLAIPAVPGLTQTSFTFVPGDTVITGFSGTVLTLPSLPPGVAPIDKTVIDVDAPSLSVFDLSTLGGAPQGSTISPAVKLSIKAKDIGQVFPLVFDTGKDGGPPNLYAAATSAYGLQIVSSKPDADGSPVRLKAGASAAQFMKGQFGGLPAAMPERSGKSTEQQEQSARSPTRRSPASLTAVPASVGWLSIPRAATSMPRTSTPASSIASRSITTRPILVSSIMA
jgi:hypothetical protein